MPYRYFIDRAKHFTPKWELFHFGSTRVLVTWPNAAAYGLFAVDILMSFRVAKGENALLYLVRPKDGYSSHGRVAVTHWVNPILMQLRSSEIRVIPNSRLLDIVANVLYRLNEVTWRHRMRVRRVLNQLISRSTAQETPIRDPFPGPYFRKALIREPMDIHLEKEETKRVEEAARKLGIGPEAPIVTLHVRESGVDRAKLVSDANVQLAARRNADVATFFRAVDFLVTRGFTVVKIGDPTMTPVDRKGVIDLACNPDKFVEYYCLIKSRFFLGVGSGPWMATYLAKTPLLMVNATHPIIEFPVRADGMFVMKHVIDIAKGTQLTLAELLEDDFLLHHRNLDRFRYVDNTDEEILLSVQEMLEFLERKPPVTPRQQLFSRLALDAARRMVAFYLVRGQKVNQEILNVVLYGIEDNFVGDGRIASWYVDRYLPAEA